EQWASDYQRALAAWALKRPDVAWTRLRQLMTEAATQPAVSQVLRETALGWLASPAKFEPIPAATVQAWVEAALADAQAGRRSALLLLAGYAGSANSAVPDARRAQVVGALRTWLATHPNDALGWQLLARLSAQQGQALVALRAEAEAFVARELWQGALDRLSAAKRLIAEAKTRFSEADIAIIYAREKAVNQAMAFARSERR
ncbi:MAG: hypothetical protein NWR82_03530, partial [Burkholderiaceae bacterium]|nr:hypothetical protein [Burkholderiaceae bacterium]